MSYLSGILGRTNSGLRVTTVMGERNELGEGRDCKLQAEPVARLDD